jgi:hypothetical protein
MRKYYEVHSLSRENAEHLLQSKDYRVVCDTMVSVAFYEKDWKWAQDQFLILLESSNEQISGLAANCLGHLARIHGQLDKDKVVGILKTKLNNPAIAGRVEEGLNDIEMFIG